MAHIIELPMERLHFSDEWLEQELCLADEDAQAAAQKPMKCHYCQDWFLFTMDRKLKLEAMGLV